MHELLEKFLVELREALRFRWHGLALAWLIALGGWAWVALQPDIYEADARVIVDTSSVLEPVLRDQIVGTRIDEQLGLIREALLGRSQLEVVAREAGLDAEVTSPAELDDLVNELGDSVLIQTGGGTRTTPDNIYTISYRHSDRDKAVAVVRAVLNSFMESAASANQRESDTREEFLDARVEEYEDELARADQALAEFKRENADRLPGAEGGYFVRLQAEQDALNLANHDLRVVESRIVQLNEQLRSERPMLPGVTDVAVDPPPGSLDARIRDHQARRDDLLLQYTESHPDVLQVEEALASLLEQRADQLQSLGIDDPGQEISGLEQNPAYQSLLTAIADAEIERTAVRANIQEREVRVAELRGLIDEVPAVEAELARLTRDYEVIYERYLELVRSRETQQLTNQASDVDRVDFNILNPPSSPRTPVAPNRLLLLAAVFGVAVGAGAALCYVLAQVLPVFNSSAAVSARIGLPVIGVVTNAWRETALARQRMAIGLYVLGLGALAVVFAGVVAIEILGPGIHELFA